MSYVSNSVWHCSYDNKKITGKVTLLEDLAKHKDIHYIELTELIHLKRSHIFSLYKFILSKKFNFNSLSLNKECILYNLIDKAFKDVDLKYPIYVLKDKDIFTVVLDGNRRLDKAYLIGENKISAKIFTLDELVYIIETHNLNN